MATLALALACGAGYAQGQTIHVGGDGVIADAILATSGGTAFVGVTGATWKVTGGTGEPVSSALVSPALAVPSTGNVTLTFTHRYDFESGWDGGAVLVSVNGNPAVYLAGTAFSSNGYVGTTTGNSSKAWPGGENVFYGQSAGYTTPALITSVANLGTLTAGDTVSISFKGEWDEGTTAGPPAWEIGSVKLTDSGSTDFLNADFSTGSNSGFTVVNGGLPLSTLAPWVFAPQTAAVSFEINGDTLAADRYVPNVAGAVINLSSAAIVVELLAGTLDGGEVFSLFDVSGNPTFTGTPASISLPPLGIWNTSNLAVNGTITFVSPPPNLTWNLTGPGDGVWDTATPNWTENGVDPTLFVPSANVTFNKADGGVITVLGMSPTTTTINSAGNYTFVSEVPTGLGAASIISGSLVKNGNGILQLGATNLPGFATNAYSNNFSSVQINAGTLHYGSLNALGSGTVTMENGTAMRKVGQEGNGAALALANNIVLNGSVNMHIQFSGFKDQWFSGVISGAGSIRVTGERRALTLTGNNSFEGGVTMENYVGTGATAHYNFDIGHVNSLGTGTLTVKTVLNPSLTQFRGLGTTTALVADSGVTNDVVIDTGATFYLGRGQDLRLGGDISGAGALFKRNTTTVFLDGTNTYTGGTTVEGGTLTINGSLADSSMEIKGVTTSTVNYAGTVNGTGTLTFNIDGAATDQISVSSGVLNGNLVATDLKVAINPSGAGLTQPEYVLVITSGGGTVTGTFASLTGAPGYELNYDTPGQVKLVNPLLVEAYATWSGGLAPDVDSNGDSVLNGVAWVLGAASPAVNAIGLLPILDNTSDPDFFIFNYRRSDDAAADTNTAMKVQYGSTLAGWVDADPLVDPGNIVITPFNDFYGTAVDKVEVKIRRTLAVGGRLFARLNVTVTTP